MSSRCGRMRLHSKLPCGRMRSHAVTLDPSAAAKQALTVQYRAMGITVQYLRDSEQKTDQFWSARDSIWSPGHSRFVNDP